MSATEETIQFAKGPLTFDAWMREVDKALEKRIGLASGDFPDWHWMDSYDSQVEPADAADDMLEEEFPEYVEEFSCEDAA